MSVPLERSSSEPKPEQETKRGLVLSDLHLFARRSDGVARLAGLETELREVDLLILNGDTFDFRWSRFPSEAATTSAALAWLADLTEAFSGREIHFLHGNHDCVRAFRDRLGALTADHPVLKCHEYHLKLGRSLFLHGDCANWKMDAASLARFRSVWSNDRPRGQVKAALYGASDAVGISRQFHRWFFPRDRAVRRVGHHLDRVMPSWRHDLDHCYFGHTHQPFRDHDFEGVRFHNTGSGIRGMEFQPLTFFVNP